jgi:hypothetical protein
MLERWTVNRATRVRFPDGTAQVTFVVIDHEILCTVIRAVSLFWHVQTFQFIAEVKATSTGKLLDSLPWKMLWLNCALVNSMWLTVVIRCENYQHHHQQINIWQNNV